jgi:two-component system capsular synthesis response regulator RcsB
VTKESTPIRVKLLDDHELMLMGVNHSLARQRDIKVVGAYTTSKDLLEGLRHIETDMVILDYSLGPGEVDGINLIKVIRTRYPAVRIIVLSSLHTPSTVALCLRCGVSGFVGKDLDARQLLAAIETVMRGEEYLDEHMRHALRCNNVTLNPLQPTDHLNEPIAALINTTSLTHREREVLRCCLDGLSVTDIARKFYRSIKTISAQKQSAYRKLGLRSDNELFKLRSQLEGR